MNLVYLAGFFLVMLYVVAPLYIKFTQKQSAQPKVEPIGELLAPALVPVARQVEALGFENVGYYVVVGLAANVTCTLAYLVHRGNGDSAVAVAMVSPVKTVHMLEFATRFADQSSLAVGNNSTIGVYRRPKNKPVFHYPYIQDPRRLYALHQGAIRLLRLGAAKDPPPPGREVERLVEGMQCEMSDQVPVGILRRDDQAGVYRPTLFGAFYMTWGLLPPFKQIKAALRRSRAEKMRRQVESDASFQAANM